MKLDGRVALISGGGTGIGAAVAALFRAEGAEVVVMGRRQTPLDEVASQTGARAFAGDASSSADVRAAVAFTLEQFGRLDVLVPNAAAGMPGPLADIDDESWRTGLDGIVTTAFLLCREAMPALLVQGGTIVIVSSLAGLFAGPRHAVYTIGKHALTGLTRTLARDYGHLGVRTNAVCPAWTRTPMADKGMGRLAEMNGFESVDDAYTYAMRRTPMRRPAEAEEIAKICLFLACEDSAAMYGAVLMADGGAHIVDLPTVDLDPDIA
jgi:NAD(P)-dependent dehydrogenase (short-subunit alcohol dehydrogenase family)